MKEIEFKDRVANYPGRIKLKKVEGTADIYEMERADEPIVEGSPLNKATFNSIIYSRLTGRYYNIMPFPTVKDTTSGTTSILPSSNWVVSGLSATSSIYKVEASSQISSTYSVEKAVDGKNDTNWGSADGSTHHYTITFPITVTVKKLSVYMGSTGATNGVVFSVLGSNDLSKWDELYKTTFTSSSYPDDGLVTYTLTKTGDYKHYRLHFTKPDTSRVYITDLQINEWAVSSYTIDFLSSEMPGQWEIGQKVTIQVPTYAAFTVSSNTFNGIKVNTILLSGKRYELRYNGTAFDAKEV